MTKGELKIRVLTGTWLKKFERDYCRLSMVSINQSDSSLLMNFFQGGIASTFAESIDSAFYLARASQYRR